MPIKDDSQHVTLVTTIGILSDKKNLHGPVNGKYMLVFYIGPVKWIAYGKGADEINMYPSGTRLFLEGKLTDDKTGLVVFLSRHTNVTHLFELNKAELEPLKKTINDMLIRENFALLEKSNAETQAFIKAEMEKRKNV
jgi:hypothetical protein